MIALVTYVALIVKPQAQQLTALLGLFFFLFALAMTSKHRSKVSAPIVLSTALASA